MINTIFSIILFFQAEEHTKSLIASPMQTVFESTLLNIASWLKLGIELVGVIIIFTGIAHAIYELIKKCTNPKEIGFTKTRLLLARYLVLALEFQLAADILSTAIAPNWEQIAKLAAIAVIRTLLNYFLTREMKEERKLIEMENSMAADDKDESET